MTGDTRGMGQNKCPTIPRTIAARKMRGGRMSPGFATREVEVLPVDLLGTPISGGHLTRRSLAAARSYAGAADSKETRIHQALNRTTWRPVSYNSSSSGAALETSGVQAVAEL